MQSAYRVPGFFLSFSIVQRDGRSSMRCDCQQLLASNIDELNRMDTKGLYGNTIGANAIEQVARA